MTGERLSLREASARLGVHYMTVYRYVRTGRLPARKNGDEWEVDAAELDALLVPGRVKSKGRKGGPAHGDRVPQLAARLIDGDEPGAWLLAQSAMAGGADPSAVYMELFVPALRLLGDRWERGEIGVAGEHRATVVMQRLIGRMGPLFRRRGRARGTVVLGAPDGELHALPAALVADLLRGEGFDVVDLGASVPVRSFVDCVRALPSVTAVGVGVTTTACMPAARRLVKALRNADPDAVLVLGGAAVSEAEALRLGADVWAADARGLVHALSAR